MCLIKYVLIKQLKEQVQLYIDVAKLLKKKLNFNYNCMLSIHRVFKMVLLYII